MLEILYATGMKVSEVIGIKVSDINLKSRFISCGSRRSVIFPLGKLQKAIEDYLEIRQEAFNKNNLDYLFLNFQEIS